MAFVRGKDDPALVGLLDRGEREDIPGVLHLHRHEITLKSQRHGWIGEDGSALGIVRVAMSHPDGEGVGGIGRRCLGEPEERPHHERDLLFISRTPSHNGLFHALRGVFEDFETMLRRGEEGGTTRRAERDGGSIALHEDDALDRADFGRKFADHVDESFPNRDEAAGLAKFAMILDHAISERPLRPAAGNRGAFFNHRETRVPQRGIDGKNAHGESLTQFAKTASGHSSGTHHIFPRLAFEIRRKGSNHAP